ncbi:RNA polymerase sigma-70 factor [Pseudobacter ginsenosidimutans]|uniref:RNA polymerase sigma-70 factor (ECF subfamily) n=1 Tax=Pseudobacter ginsenosidimutans TaxID=661488 RepID=A0A4Q7MYI6_9BACT|nr:RNA polymerase sigma-70 factor [Pseudobacter ginsenosidimutans]RZS74287.1 RNA polymerase sigma-70 factor (ECF subfamily) [Pseudobacter ginsenosidimutans]
MENIPPHTGPALLLRIIEDDTRSFDQLFMEMYAPVFLLTSRLTGDDESARDIVSDVFLQLWEKRKSLTHVKDVKAYLYVAARNRALNHLRKIRQTEKHEQHVSLETEGEPASDDFLPALFSTEMIRVLHSAIRELPAECKKVMELTIDGQTTNEIAALLSISASAVSHQKKRALRLLREKIPADLLLVLFYLSN